MACRSDVNLRPGRHLRPEIELLGTTTRVLAEQTAAIDPSRLEGHAGHLSFDELRQIDAALRLVLQL